MLEDSEVERALVVMAHPDDVDFGAAGTVALWNRAGISVTYGIVTDGDAGGFDPAIPRAEIPGIRQREQRAAAAVVGVSDVHFLGYTDGDVNPSPGLARWITILYTALAASAATFVLLQYATLRLPSAKVMAYTYLTPSWVILWQIALVGELPAPLIFVGVAATAGALLMLLRSEA